MWMKRVCTYDVRGTSEPSERWVTGKRGKVVVGGLRFTEDSQAGCAECAEAAGWTYALFGSH